MATVTRLDGTPVTLRSKCMCCKCAINSNNEGFFNRLCELCYESAGVYNEHLDSSNHAQQDCPLCLDIECMHEIQS